LTIELKLGDITHAQTDAIVNAAKSSLLGGGGVDGAIHQAAGPELLAACRAIPAVDDVRCPTGQARITPGFKLKAKFVIHTVGPVYQEHDHPSEALINAYRNSLRLALENGCTSVALPAISCGVYGYPSHEAATIAVATCQEPEFDALRKVFYLFSPDLLHHWRDALAGG
jgi:O-acetyl-ADP-ribose deacetylase (regulator of RNase III)